MADAFARCLVGASPALRRLQHKYCTALPCDAFGHRARNRATNFLIAVQQELDLAVERLQLPQNLDSGKAHHHARLHIQNARPADAVALFAERHSLNRADFPHCVQMSKQKQWRWVRPALRAKGYLKQIAELTLAMQLDAPLFRLAPTGHQRHRAIYGNLIAAWRFNAHELRDILDHLVLALDC